MAIMAHRAYRRAYRAFEPRIEAIQDCPVDWFILDSRSRAAWIAATLEVWKLAHDEDGVSWPFSCLPVKPE